ncbi:hypothetical protein RIF29_05159 [Crotalaria pallida]|uniref:RRM domain-containing protein n=1 Tax=Crotalaria pallida TaxID=3830 RepID=A0AAN9P9L9_CROPI
MNPSLDPFDHNMNQNRYGFEGTAAEVAAEGNPSANVNSLVTLLIKNLPEAIPHDTLSRILSHYGASSVRPCSTARLRNCAFVDFRNDILASQAQRQLNGLRFLGKVLSAERASNRIESGEKSAGAQLGKDSKTSVVKNADGDTKSGGLPIPEPIAERLGVDYPFPPHLEYAYPPPDGNILTNIVNALIAVPRFYTQVLHLMNKMNIPPPFRMALPTPPLPPEVPPPPPPPLPPPSVYVKPQPADLSSGESEMESSDEEDGARTKKSGKKRPRHETIVGPAINKDVAHEAVGVKPATLVPKEIPMIKKRNPVLQINIAPKATLNEHKDDDTKQELQDPDNDVPEPNKFLTPEELESGKLPPEEILSLPMFKNYTAGNPSPVLYIKNLAKDVITDDFYFIFGSLFGSIEAAKSSLQIKLMQEGRMRGQAFITFPSIELAHHGLNLVNGYVLKGKPMIIQFGRNPGAAKGT